MYPEGFDATAMKKKPICGVLAVAIAAGVSYPVAHAACKRAMHKLDLGKRFRGATFWRQRAEALKGFGVRFTVFDVKAVGHMSVIEFCADRYAYEPEAVYMIDIRGHTMILRQGCIIDQSNYIPWQSYAHPRVRVKRAVRIDGKGW
jgi:hypothetical protein